MSDEVKIKISQPMFEVGELERFDNNIHSIVKEYSKMMFKEKDQILTQRIIMKQDKEIERLHSIIKEARDFIKGKDLKEKEYRFAEDFDFAKLLKILDEEVETIEQDKKIVKLKNEDCYKDDRYGYSINIGNITNKINEIIDYINKGENND